MKCKVSVVVTVYNVKDYIASCIESILNQDFEVFELIIVDDGSPDNSMDIAEKYALKDSRVHLIYGDGNHGLMCARRLGYMHAQGDYVVFVDSDDNLPPSALSTLHRAIVDSAADIVSGYAKKILPNGTIIKMPNILRNGTNKEEIYRSLMKGEFLHNMWGKIYKRELLQDYQYTYFDKLTNAEDICLFYQLVEHVNKIVCIDVCVYNYMINSESSSQVRFSRWRLECFVKAYDLVIKVLSKYPELKKLSIAYAQRNLSRLCARGYNEDGMIDNLLKEYNLSNLFSLPSIVRNNTFKNASLVLLGRTRLGAIIYRKRYRIK